jgi:predicted nucleotidyltransferase
MLPTICTFLWVNNLSTFLPCETIYLNSHIKDVLQKETASLFYTCISGSHLYGMNSPDSDIDIRGCFVLNSHNFLGLNRPIDHKDWSITEVTPKFPHPNGIEICLNEVAKETSLALKSNCNVLEHLVAKPVYADADALYWRKMLLDKMTATGIYNSYKGMATFNYHKYLKTAQKKTVKKYLYVFRGLLAGTYALQNGCIEPNLTELSRCYQISEVKELLKIKSKGTEKEILPSNLDDVALDKVLVDLFERIDKAYEHTKLPKELEQDAFDEVNQWLIKLRRKHLT